MSILEAEVFKGELRRLRGGGDDADYVLGHLGPRFTEAEMEGRLSILEEHVATRRQAKRTVGLMRKIAERSYSVRFESGTPLSEQVLLPAMSAESKGMEDARFVRFVDDDGDATYFASYTAYNGTDIGQQLLETKDFLSFTSSPMVGAAAANKGLALFPRRIGGRFVALSRSDRESNTIAYSETSASMGRGARMPGADETMGSRSTRQLRVAYRDRSGLVGTHARGRPHAHLQHRGHLARARGPHSRDWPASRATAQPSSPMSRTAMYQMSSTPAAPSSMPAPWSFPTGSATLRSASRWCSSTNFSPP